MKKQCRVLRTVLIVCAALCCLSLAYMALYRFYFAGLEALSRSTRPKALYLYAAHPVFALTFSFLCTRFAARRDLNIPRRLFLALGLAAIAVYPFFCAASALFRWRLCFDAMVFLMQHPWLFLLPGVCLGLSVNASSRRPL